MLLAASNPVTFQRDLFSCVDKVSPKEYHCEVNSAYYEIHESKVRNVCQSSAEFVRLRIFM